MIPISIAIFIILYIITQINDNLRDKKWAKNLRILLMYDIASITVIYPISDESHFAIGTICTLITLVYLLYEIIKHIPKLRDKKKFIFALKTFIEAIAICLMLVFISKSMISLTKFVQDTSNQTYLEHFKYITANENLQKRVNIIDEFIHIQKAEGKEVYVLDTMAAVFMIPTGEYHKNYDMFNVGNFGAKGENGLIEELSQKENLIVLILNDNQTKNWQLPTKVIQYVKEEFTYIGSIVDIFDVYEV